MVRIRLAALHHAAMLLHNSHYDFNDQTLAVGAAYRVSLANYLLPVL